MTVEEWKRKNPPIQRKPSTNYDRIISKTPEELAEWIASNVLNLTGASLKMATEAWVEWLQKKGGNYG